MEVTGLRTEESSTFAQPDGSLRAEVATGPKNVLKDGELVPLDLSLQSVGGRLVPKASPSSVSFSPGPSGKGGAVASLDVAAGMSLRLGEGLSLPAPLVTGATAIYRQVRSGVDLKLVASPSGFEYSWLVTERPSGPLDLSMPLGTTGVSPVLDGSGRLSLRDSRGTEVARGLPPLMWDADRTASGVPVATRPVAQQLLGSGARRVLDLKPDMGFPQDAI